MGNISNPEDYEVGTLIMWWTGTRWLLCKIISTLVQGNTWYESSYRVSVLPVHSNSLSHLAMLSQLRLPREAEVENAVLSLLES